MEKLVLSRTEESTSIDNPDDITPIETNTEDPQEIIEIPSTEDWSEMLGIPRTSDNMGSRKIKNKLSYHSKTPYDRPPMNYLA